MIVPDEKDWTWVIDRACPDCGFDASTTSSMAVADLIRRNAGDWRSLIGSGRIHSGRPDDQTWSSLEYACHVRDVYRRYLERLELMLTQNDPLFPNWDQDASAVDDAYDTQDPKVVAAELSADADALALRLDHLTADEWARPGRRSDGASFTVDRIVRYMIHDPIHHVWDVTRQRY